MFIWLLTPIIFFCSSCRKTGDFVVKWKKVNSSYSGSIANICFISKDTGFVLGSYNSFTGNTIWQKTFDGGETWIIDTIRTGELKAHITTLATYNHFLFAGGFLSSSANLPRRTYSSTDNGSTWKIIDTTFIRGANCVNLNSSEIVLSNTLGIYKSYNGGVSFQLVYTEASGLNFSFIQFPDISTGIASGGFSNDGISVSTMAKTNDGGATWTKINSGLPRIISMQFFDKNNGLVFVYDEKGDISHITYSDVKLYRTYDGANTWQLIRENLKSDFGFINSTYFTDPYKGFLTADQSIYSTSDGGHNWTKEFDAGPIVSQGNYMTGLYFNPPNHFFAFSTDGTIYKRLE